jgi:hypothetical protein
LDNLPSFRIEGNPELGNNFRYTAKKIIKFNPNQNVGIDAKAIDALEMN